MKPFPVLSSVVAAVIAFVSSHGHCYTISRTTTYELQSSINKKTYEIYVRTPKNYSETLTRFPIVLVNDSDWAFPTASGISELLMGNDIQPFILVGISYSRGDTPGVSRTRDYTPTFAPEETSFHSVAAKKVSGHAADYLNFIKSHVFPLLEKKYRIDKQSRIFVGHSFGGLLGSFALVSQPELFSAYIIGSPSLWYDNNAIFKLEADYAAKHNAMKTQALFYVGDSESKFHDMLGDMEKFAATLRSRKYYGLQLHTQVIANATHHSAFAHLLSHALPQVLPKETL